MDRFLKLTCAALFVSLFATTANAADAGHGKALFEAKCTLCHNADKGGPNKLGPNLWGVVNRPSASVPNFSYSMAMQGAHLVWSPDKLQTYLAGPQNMIPGIRMTFSGFSNPSDAQDVVAYLVSLK
jgi:cytochrome c